MSDQLREDRWKLCPRCENDNRRPRTRSPHSWAYCETEPIEVMRVSDHEAEMEAQAAAHDLAVQARVKQLEYEIARAALTESEEE